jgi:hypothetical protein
MSIRMRTDQTWIRCATVAPRNFLLGTIFVLQSGFYSLALGQSESPPSTVQQMQQLIQAMNRTEAQLAASQQQIIQLRREVDALQLQIAHDHNSAGLQADAGSVQSDKSQPDKQLAQAIEDISERQAVQQSEITTQEQSKVESGSKYPVKISGLVLMNGFVNSSAVDSAPTPTIALPGGGSTGASLRQTILGVDARGPHLFGALSSADLRVDFDGASGAATYNNTAGLVRLRTAHAALVWPATQLFFALDRPILSPNAPSSLTAIAEPPLAWSGNLWSWNPQLGIQHDFTIAPSYRFRVQTALIDAANPPGLTLSTTQPLLPAPSDSERSRWPGIQTRIALLGADSDRGAAFGVGGYYSPHQTVRGYSYDAWAATVDYRLPLPAHLELTGSAYRGAALGGLGGGAFKDYAFGPDPISNSIYVQPLDDVGGWTQLKQRLTERLEWNAAYGIDNLFAGQLRPFATAAYAPYLNLARNRTFFSNVIYSPSAYLLFSLEYRHLQSSPVNSPTSTSNIFGLAAAYKF